MVRLPTLGLLPVAVTNSRIIERHSLVVSLTSPMANVLVDGRCFFERCSEDGLVRDDLLRAGVAHHLDGRSVVERSHSQLSHFAVSLPLTSVLGTECAVFNLQKSLDSSVNSLACNFIADEEGQSECNKENECLEAETSSVVAEVVSPSSATVK